MSLNSHTSFGHETTWAKIENKVHLLKHTKKKSVNSSVPYIRYSSKYGNILGRKRCFFFPLLLLK